MPAQNRPLSEAAVTVDMTDISTPATVLIASPFRGCIKRISVIIAAAITVANSNITFTVNGTTVANVTLVAVASGSAPGSVFSVDVPYQLTSQVQEGDAIGIVNDGGSTTTSRATFTVVIDRD